MTRKRKQPGSRKKGISRIFMPFALLAAAVAGGFILGAWSSDNPVGGEAARPAVAEKPSVAPAVPAPAAAAVPPAAASITRVRLQTDGAPSVGPADAPVTVVEFVDYQCPFCRRAHRTVKQVAEKYGDQVRLVFVQNPLAFHKDAPLAAQAALAAGEQGRFSEMQDLLLT
ncbi:MAG: DsbA family protein, partial [Acidobacteriota bacterium]